MCSRIDFSNPRTRELEALYHACKPAEFGRDGESVLDESYRKAGKMDLTSFATLFDPRSLGIHEQISKALLTQSLVTMDMELYKLNVYGEYSGCSDVSTQSNPSSAGEGDFFKPHKDTPRGQDMFGSLVVVLPTAYGGGQFVLRHGEKEWTIDFAKFAAAKEPSVCFLAFYSDVEHEVLPVTSGHRVSLTYNLYHKPIHATAPIQNHTPFHLQLKQALIDLLNDKSKLPNGGYLGFGLAHEYVHTGRNLLELLPAQLKGSDRALADVCDELGLRYSLRLLYRGIADETISLLTTKELDVEEDLIEDDFGMSGSEAQLRCALEVIDAEQVERINFVGWPYKPSMSVDEKQELLGPIGGIPATEVLDIMPMKSTVGVKSTFVVPYYGNAPGVDHFYGTACMLVAVEPAASRNLIGL